MDHFVSGSNFGCLIQQSGSVLRKPGLGGRLDSIQGRCNVGCLRSRFNCEVMTENVDLVGDDGRGDLKEDIKKKHQGFFDSILAATGAVGRERLFERPNATFVISGTIDHYLLGSLGVDGAGVLGLPLSAADAAKLRMVSKQAPHGRGLNTVLDTTVRSAWQVDAFKVTFPSDPDFLTRVQRIADRAVKVLEGNNEVQVEANLYKLLFYEAGGHFKMHRDTEKEPGMFATLIVQLPTEGGYEGGALVVNQETWSCKYNAGSSHIGCFQENTSTAFHYAAFFADCRHTLRRITAGTRLCLSFNLVRRTSNGGPKMEQILHSPMFRDVEAVLRPWLEAIDEDDAEKSSHENLKFFRNKLAIPLQHKYTPSNLKFSRLKGEDVTLFHVLANCLDRHLDLHLCLLTKHQVGQPEVDNGIIIRIVWNEGHSAARGKQAGGCITMESMEAEWVETSDWVDVDDHRLPIFPWYLDTEKEVVLGKDENGLFVNGEDPDELQYEGYWGNEGPTLEYFYHRAMMVVWPKTKTVPTIIAERRPNNAPFSWKFPEGAEVPSLINFVERLKKNKEPCVRLAVSQLLAHCERAYEAIWRKRDRCVESGCTDMSKCVSSRLLNMCVVAGDLADTLRVLKLYSEIFQEQKYDSNGRPSHTVPWFIGLRSKCVAKSIAAAVHAHGWAACGEAVLRLLQKDRVREEGEYYGQLALELEQLGRHSEAFVVANKALKLVTSSMTPLQSSSELLKILVKLMMSMSTECRKELGSKLLQWLGPAPEFCWNQPFAHLPRHPTVEAFLRGSHESFTYENVPGCLPEARKLAQVFDGRYKNGYCAIGREGVSGSGAYCVIKKSRDGFQHVLDYWERQQEQVRELRHEFRGSGLGAREERETSDGSESSDTQAKRAVQKTPKIV